MTTRITSIDRMRAPTPPIPRRLVALSALAFGLAAAPLVAYCADDEPGKAQEPTSEWVALMGPASLSAASTQLGDHNISQIQQFGQRQVATVNQSGGHNQADITQSGSGLSADARQSGQNNEALFIQQGIGHDARTTQSGELNRSIVIQTGTRGTDALINQRGVQNQATVVLTQPGPPIYMDQAGARMGVKIFR